MLRSIVAAFALVTVAAAPPVSPKTEIENAMNASAAGWNRGDLDGFMAIYADDATFVTPKGLLRDKAAIAEHYRPSFAGNGNVRGRLTFQPLGMRSISATHQLLFARWTLTLVAAGGKTETGMTTLVFERRPKGWQIIADHSN